MQRHAGVDTSGSRRARLTCTGCQQLGVHSGQIDVMRTPGGADAGTWVRARSSPRPSPQTTREHTLAEQPPLSTLVARIGGLKRTCPPDDPRIAEAMQELAIAKFRAQIDAFLDAVPTLRPRVALGLAARLIEAGGREEPEPTADELLRRMLSEARS